MGIITKGMGAIMKGAKKRKTLTISFPKSKPSLPSTKREVIIKKKSKPSTTKLADTWQDRRIQAMNRKLKREKGTVDKYIDEHGAVSASKAPTKKVYKSAQKKWHGLTPDQQSKMWMKKAKRDPKSFHFDKKKFGKK
jgi:hypothetical protein